MEGQFDVHYTVCSSMCRTFDYYLNCVVEVKAHLPTQEYNQTFLDKYSWFQNPNLSLLQL